jgi:hypothetical protein
VSVLSSIVVVPLSTDTAPPRLPLFRSKRLVWIRSEPSLRIAPPCPKVAVLRLPVSSLSSIATWPVALDATPPPSSATLSAKRLAVIVTMPPSVKIPPPISAAELPSTTTPVSVTSP